MTYITSDTRAAYRGLKPQTALMRLASGMSRTIDRQQPRKLNDAQKTQLDCRPEVRLLCRRQKKMFQFIKDNHGPIASMKGTSVYNKYQKVYQAHRNMKRRQEEVLLQEIKARYKREQPVIDIHRQLKGLPSVELETARQRITSSRSVSGSSTPSSPSRRHPQRKSANGRWKRSML